MIKYIIILLNMLGLMFYHAFIANDVTIKQNVPSSADAGSEFTVEVFINKGSTGGFAKFQQELPAGFTAIAGENAGASFTFTDQTVKFIWMSLPNDPEIKITYKIKVDAAATAGDKIISGKFSYVFNNVKNTVAAPEATISVKGTEAPVAAAQTEPEPAPTPEPAPQATDNTTPPAAQEEVAVSNVPSPQPEASPAQEAAAPQPAPSTQQTAPAPAQLSTTSSGGQGIVSCQRSIPQGELSGEFKVELTINKNDLAGFAKLQENLPAGFTARSAETAGASFTFADQKAKFVWVSLPAEPTIHIAYFVTPGTTSGTQSIDGLFSYILNDETQKHIIPASNVNIAGGGTIASAPVTKSTEPTATTTATINEEQSKPPVVQNETTAAKKEKMQGLAPSNIPSAQTGVNYKVQICALKKQPVAYSYFTKKYNINEEIYTEMHEGWTKYTLGKFSVYKDARDQREVMREKGVTGPFVTAYNSGNRITVQEALMISNQQWYK